MMVLLSWQEWNPFCSTWVPRHLNLVCAISHIALFLSISTAVLQLSQHSNWAMSSCYFTEILNVIQLKLPPVWELSWKNVLARKTAAVSALPISRNKPLEFPSGIACVGLGVCCGNNKYYNLRNRPFPPLTGPFQPPHLGYFWSALYINTLLRTLGTLPFE